MSALLSTGTSIVTSSVGWIGSFAKLFTETVQSGDATVLANPILLIPVGLMVAGFGIGALRRLFSVR